jgi:hypothetical protein
VSALGCPEACGGSAAVVGSAGAPHERPSAEHAAGAWTPAAGWTGAKAAAWAAVPAAVEWATVRLCGTPDCRAATGMGVNAAGMPVGMSGRQHTFGAACICFRSWAGLVSAWLFSVLTFVALCIPPSGHRTTSAHRRWLFSLVLQADAPPSIRRCPQQPNAHHFPLQGERFVVRAMAAAATHSTRAYMDSLGAGTTYDDIFAAALAPRHREALKELTVMATREAVATYLCPPPQHRSAAPTRPARCSPCTAQRPWCAGLWPAAGRRVQRQQWYPTACAPRSVNKRASCHYTGIMCAACGAWPDGSPTSCCRVTDGGSATPRHHQSTSWSATLRSVGNGTAFVIKQVRPVLSVADRCLVLLASSVWAMLQAFLFVTSCCARGTAAVLSCKSM